MSNLKMVLREYTFLMKVFDWFMVPLMWVASGFTTDSLQKTHAWHVQRVSPANFSQFIHSHKSLVKVKGDDGTWMKKKNRVFFHVPILGGWRNYVVLAPLDSVGSDGWRIGWVTISPRKEYAVNKIPLHGPVKMLVGPESQEHVFIGIETYEDLTPSKHLLGRQIPLVVIGRGVNGDKKYSHLPLL